MGLEIPPGARRTLVVTFKEPPSVDGTPLLPVQTMVNRPTVSTDVSACGVRS
jgi:hypothetical protein